MWVPGGQGDTCPGLSEMLGPDRPQASLVGSGQPEFRAMSTVSRGSARDRWCQAPVAQTHLLCSAALVSLAQVRKPKHREVKQCSFPSTTQRTEPGVGPRQPHAQAHNQSPVGMCALMEVAQGTEDTQEEGQGGFPEEVTVVCCESSINSMVKCVGSSVSLGLSSGCMTWGKLFSLSLSVSSSVQWGYSGEEPPPRVTWRILCASVCESLGTAWGTQKAHGGAAP